MDHLGSGREWDLVRKKGGLNIVPPYAEKTVAFTTAVLRPLQETTILSVDQKKYAVLADANIALNFDFNALIEAHEASKADVTMAYKEEPLSRRLWGHL